MVYWKYFVFLQQVNNKNRRVTWINTDRNTMENNNLFYAEQVLKSAIDQVENDTNFDSEDIFDTVCMLLDIKVTGWKYGYNK